MDIVPEGGHIACGLHLLGLINVSVVSYILLGSRVAGIGEVVDEGVLVKVRISSSNIFF